MAYRTRAINNSGLNSGKTFWVLACGYYSKEVTIQEKLFLHWILFTTLFHKILGFLSLDCQDLDYNFLVLSLIWARKESQINNLLKLLCKSLKIPALKST